MITDDKTVGCRNCLGVFAYKKEAVPIETASFNE